jgi:hypothetical protein
MVGEDKSCAVRHAAARAILSISREKPNYDIARLIRQLLKVADEEEAAKKELKPKE